MIFHVVELKKIGLYLDSKRIIHQSKENTLGTSSQQSAYIDH